MISYLVRLLSLGIILFLCYGWWVSSQARYYQVELGPSLEEKYGFNTGSPMVIAGGDPVEVLTIYPKAGGLMETAGFENGDIVLSTSLTGFYKSLSESKGVLNIEVVSGGDGAPIGERDRRTITLNSVLWGQ